MAEQLQALLQALQGGSGGDAASQVVATMANLMQQQHQQNTYLQQQPVSLEARLQQSTTQSSSAVGTSTSAIPMLVDTQTLGGVERF